jgi:hypothetical protein
MPIRIFLRPSKQSRSVLPALSDKLISFGLIAVSTWVSLERWTFFKYDGEKLLSDIIKKAYDRALDPFDIHRIRKRFSATTKAIKTVGKDVKRAFRRLFKGSTLAAKPSLCLGDKSATDIDDDALEANTHTKPSAAERMIVNANTSSSAQNQNQTQPTTAAGQPRIQSRPRASTSASLSGRRRSHSTTTIYVPERLKIPLTNSITSTSPATTTMPITSLSTNIHDAPQPGTMIAVDGPTSPGMSLTSPVSPTGPVTGRQRWRDAIRTVQSRTAVSSNLAAYGANAALTSALPPPKTAVVRDEDVGIGGGGGRGGVGSALLVPRAPDSARGAGGGVQTPLPLPATPTTAVPALAPGSTATELKSRQRVMIPDAPITLRSSSGVAALIAQLRGLDVVQDIPVHRALVKHLQFSPDGKYLATSSWDRTSVIFRVADPHLSPRILAHTKGFVTQVAWSPSGNMLLTKLTRGIKLWDEEGVCLMTVERQGYVESIKWFPGGEAFLFVEESIVTKVDLTGKVRLLFIVPVVLGCRADFLVLIRFLIHSRLARRSFMMSL